MFFLLWAVACVGHATTLTEKQKTQLNPSVVLGSFPDRYSFPSKAKAYSVRANRRARGGRIWRRREERCLLTRECVCKGEETGDGSTEGPFGLFGDVKDYDGWAGVFQLLIKDLAPSMGPVRTIQIASIGRDSKTLFPKLFAIHSTEIQPTINHSWLLVNVYQYHCNA